MRNVTVALIAALFFALAIGSGWWLENKGWYNPVTGERTCDAPPSVVKAWSYTHATRKASDLNNLEHWIKRNPEAVNRRYGVNCTAPLHEAARFGREDIAELLISYGADLHAREGNGDTPLHAAAKYAHSSVVELLILHGAQIDLTGQDGMTPLHNVAYGLIGGTVEARLKVARILLDAGADVNAREPNSGYTPLRYAAGPSLSNSPELAALLLQYGAGAGGDALRSSELVNAAASGDSHTVQLLLDRGADVNSANRDTTALGAASYACRFEIVSLLLERGADVNRRAAGSRLEWQGSPLAMALAIYDSSDQISFQSRSEIAEALLANGAEVDVRNAAGETLLHRTASKGDVAAVELLLRHGADLEARSGAGFTPLHQAVMHGWLEAAALLLSRGADPRTEARDGATALELAFQDPEMEGLIRRYAKD